MMRERSWPTPHRVALLTYTLSDVPSQLHAPIMKRWMSKVCESAIGLGWDRRSKVVCTGIGVPGAWLRSIAKRSGVDMSTIHGISVGRANATEAELVAAAHVCCCELLRFQEKLWGVPSNIVVFGYEVALAMTSDVLLSEPSTCDFQSALRESTSVTSTHAQPLSSLSAG